MTLKVCGNGVGCAVSDNDTSIANAPFTNQSRDLHCTMGCIKEELPNFVRHESTALEI